MSPAPVAQIMNLTLLVPDIQEALLGDGAQGVTERELRGLMAMVDWGEQRRSGLGEYGAK